MSILFALLFSLSAFADDGLCPVGDIKACQEALKTEHAKPDSEFVQKYNEICSLNPKFSCIKIIVRADMEEEMKEQAKKRGPKAALFNVKLDGETFIFVLAEKPVKK